VTQASPRRPRWLLFVVIPLAILAVAALAVGALRRVQGDPPDRPALSVVGTLTLYDGLKFTAGVPCAGSGGYADLGPGTQVVVYGPQDETLGVGSLEEGYGHVDGYLSSCVWSFQVSPVAAGKGFYGVEVAHRGKLRYTEAQLHDELHVTLGR
jgi:hypothetical protein